MNFIKNKVIKEFKEKDFKEFGTFWGIYNYDIGKKFIRKAKIENLKKQRNLKKRRIIKKKK